MRLSSQAAEEAFCDAGFQPDAWSLEERRRCGVVIGTGGGSWEFTERQYQRYLEGGNGAR